MYIAMNRFKISPGRETEFEKIWKERDTTGGSARLSGLPFGKGKSGTDPYFVCIPQHLEVGERFF